MDEQKARPWSGVLGSAKWLCLPSRTNACCILHQTWVSLGDPPACYFMGGGLESGYCGLVYPSTTLLKVLSVAPLLIQSLCRVYFAAPSVLQHLPPCTLSTEGPVSGHTGSPWLPGFGGQWWLNRPHIIGILSTRPQLHSLQGTVGILWPLWLILVSVLSSPGHQPTATFLLTWSSVALWTQALWIFSTWSPFNSPSTWDRGYKSPRVL